MNYRVQTFFIVVLLQMPLAAQNMGVSIGDLDFSGLPRVTFTTCVTSSDTLFPSLAASNFSFTENGVPHQLTLRCPESGKINSVLLVVDNSGSISSVLGKIIEAASILVDSLGVNDEAGVLTFSRDIVLRQDFTTDKVLLKQALAAMQANGGTPLRDAAYQACGLLQARSGKRHMVILTDGEDTGSRMTTVDSVIIRANAENIRIYAIAFALAQEHEKEMKRMGEETGGLFFSVQRPSELLAVYAEIAALITEPCCTAEYFSINCDDSIRTLALRIDVNGDTAITATTVATPYRPRQMQLWVDVPAEMAGNQTGTGMVYIAPPPSTEIELTLGFTLNYNDDLLSISPPFAQSLGTITQNQNVQMTKIGPSKMRFFLNKIKPAMLSNKLVGFPLLAQRSDSSRDEPVAFVDSVTIEGCPVEFTTAPDTTRICSCYQQLPLTLTVKEYNSYNEQIRIPIYLTSGLVKGIGFSLSVDVVLPQGFSMDGIESGNIFDPNLFQWSAIGADQYRVEVPGFSLPYDTAGLLCTLIATTPVLKKAQTHFITFRNHFLMQKCCPDAQPAQAFPIVVDGICDKLIRRRADASVSTAPNPVVAGSSADATITVTLNESHTGGRYDVRIIDVHGATVRHIADQDFASGSYTFRVPVGDLPSGTYMTVFSNSKERVSDNFVVVH